MVTGFCFPGVNTWGWGGRIGWRARLSAKAGRSHDPRRPLCTPAGRAGPGHRSSAAAPAPGLRVHLAPPPKAENAVFLALILSPSHQGCQAPFYMHISSLVKGLLRLEGSLCFRHKSLSDNVICKYILSAYGLSFCSPNSIF